MHILAHFALYSLQFSLVVDLFVFSSSNVFLDSIGFLANVIYCL
jgi:hypothetical protein